MSRLGTQDAPLMRDLFEEANRARLGRPYIVGRTEEILAASQQDIVLPVKSTAPFALEHIAVVIDDTPLYTLAAIPLDVVSIRWQSEIDQTETVIFDGIANILAVFGANGVVENRYLTRMGILHPGSEITIGVANRDGADPHVLSITAHGFLVSREEMRAFYGS